MYPAFLCSVALASLLVSAETEPTKVRRQDKFVTAKGNKFFVNGSEFRFVGTNAYWLSSLNTEEDVIATLGNISAAGINVVRTWAFNDVDTIPEDNSTWFQLIANGTTTINNGTNGLAKLDTVVKHAENMGIYLMLTLTNNWNPRPLFDNLTLSLENLSSTVEPPTLSRRDISQGTNNTLPRNTLSNDYGGMDLYVRQFGFTNHDDFYNDTLLAAFKNYTNHIVSRYVESPFVLAWEIANDPRCNSSVAASVNCKTTTVTQWISNVSQHIRSIDPNHLITSGNQGFVCSSCPKLFPRATSTPPPLAPPPPPPPPPPAVSPAPGTRRNVWTEAKLTRELKKRQKKRNMLARAAQPASGMRMIKGKWMAPPTKRQDSPGVSSQPFNDGSQGVDSEDIINIPDIGFGTFQLFPDQNVYGPSDPNLPSFNNTVEMGIDWIMQQAAISHLFGKPISLTGFGLVTQENAPFFVPFNASVAPFGIGVQGNSSTVQPFGVTDQQRDDAYQQWLNAGIAAGLQGIIQYQWGQSNLTAINGTAIQPDVNSTSQSPNPQPQTGQSPNDGYSIQGTGEEAAQSIIQQAAQTIGSG